MKTCLTRPSEGETPLHTYPLPGCEVPGNPTHSVVLQAGTFVQDNKHMLEYSSGSYTSHLNVNFSRIYFFLFCFVFEALKTHKNVSTRYCEPHFLNHTVGAGVRRGLCLSLSFDFLTSQEAELVAEGLTGT